VLSLPPHLYDPNTLPSPIVPLLTSSPRPLSTHLQSMGLNVRPITWPTVPKGKERVRICLHAENTKADVELLVEGVMQWTERVVGHRRPLRDGGVEAKL
jgi:8-amino-7-oxononanoate synthase